MRQRQELNLSTFDGQLLDGLEFCRKVYDMFDYLQADIDGVARLRLRPTKTEKRLIEELLPIASYVQARYRVGRRIKVRWLSGSQSYDAVLWSSGGLVRHRMAPRKLVVEVTTSVHPNEYLVRRLLHERGGSFGVKGISRNKKAGVIVSEPSVHTPDELSADMAEQIMKRLRTKSAKDYPPDTVLIVNCVPNSLILDSEWNDAIERVTRAQLHLAFLEVFLIEPVSAYSATLYGTPKRAKQQ